MKLSSYGSFKYESRKNIVKVSSLNPFLVHMSNVECLQLDARVGSKWKKVRPAKVKRPEATDACYLTAGRGTKARRLLQRLKKFPPPGNGILSLEGLPTFSDW